MTAPLRLALFDCDGTLVDSQFAILAAMAEACRAHGIAAPEPSAIRRVIGLPLVEAVGRLRPDLDEATRHTVAASYREAFASQRRDDREAEPLYPGIREALDRLDAAGVLLGIATGKSGRGLRAVLDGHGLTGRFVTLQTADHGPGKPHPAMVHRALTEAGVTPDAAVMIGDTVFDVQMARAARISALGVAWGYHAPAELGSAGAARIVFDTTEMVVGLFELLRIQTGEAVSG